MERIIRREMWERTGRGHCKIDIEVCVGGSGDQMSFCWKTPEGYLFVSQQQGKTETELEKKKKSRENYRE